MEATVICDHIEKFAVSPNECHNELETLHELSAGIHWIASQVGEMDAAMSRAFRSVRALPLEFSEMPPALPCLFHWYGNTVINYARLVGFLGGISRGVYTRNATEETANFGLISSTCDAYVAGVPELEAVLFWRNKVFAHFAITDPRKGKEPDNAALLDYSTMAVPDFKNSYGLGGQTVMIRGTEQELPWFSIGETHRLLAPRFWPQEF